jgi:ABC-type transporter Mla subunit MlaD
LGVTVDNLSEVVGRKTGEADTAIATLNDAEKKLAGALADVQKAAADAAAKATKVEVQQSFRHLSDDDKTALITAIKPFPHQKVSVEYVSGTVDGDLLSRDFINVFSDAGWDVAANSPSQIFITGTLLGVQPTIRGTDGSVPTGSIPPAYLALISTLAEHGWIPRRSVYADPSLPADLILIKIGPRAPPK